MIRQIRRWGLAVSVFTAGGCFSGPMVENPVRIGSHSEYPSTENPLLVAPGDPGPVSYAEVYEQVLSVISVRFPIAYSNRYDGRIITKPVTGPGLGQLWKTGSPDLRERLLASAQSYRYRADVRIEAAPQGGYLVRVEVWKELEDLPVPITPFQNHAAFATSSTVDRVFEVVTPEVTATNWIPKGRETWIEQAILNEIRSCP